VLSLELRALARWGEGMPDEMVEVESPEGGSTAARPRLEPSAAPGGALAARVTLGDGTPVPVVLLGRDDGFAPVFLESAPLAIAARDDGGCWALHSDQLVHHDATGRPVRADAGSASSLVAAPAGAVWAIDSEAAALIGADGRPAGRWRWDGGEASVPAEGGSVAARDGARVRVLGPDGEETSVAAEPPLGTDERLLCAAGGALLTRVAGGVRRRSGGRVLQVPVESAGLGADGTPWVARLADAPLDWELGAVTGTPAGTVLLSASGALGAALIELRLAG